MILKPGESVRIKIKPYNTLGVGSGECEMIFIVQIMHKAGTLQAFIYSFAGFFMETAKVVSCFLSRYRT